MPSLGPMEMLVIFVVALLVLGPSKLPETGRQIGKALAEFRRWTSGVQGELRNALEVEVEPDYGATVPDAGGPVAKNDRGAAPGLRSPAQFPDEQSFS